MNEKQYYRAYSNLIKRHERLSYQIVLKGFKQIYTKAAKEYLNNPSIPIDLLVSESDTLDILVNIYNSVGMATASMVFQSLPKQKASNLILQTKAKKPTQYKPTPEPPIDHINYWKTEFLRFTQSKDCAKKVSGITKTTKEQIRQVMQQAVEEQLSHKQTAKLILEKADAIDTKKRALLIARTENAVGSNKGAMYAAKSSGLVLYKKWIARSGDSRTRDAHAGMVDSTPIPIDQAFEVGGEKMMQPGDSSLGAKAHNICNCRCTVAFIPASEVIQQGVNNPVPVKKPVKQPDLFDKPILIQDLNRFKPASTVKEAQQWIVNNQIAKEANIDWIKDVDVANEVNGVLFELKNRFGFDSLVQIGNNPKQNSALMSANYKTLNIRNSYWKTNDIIKKNYQSNTSEGYQVRMTKNLEIARHNYESTKNYRWLKIVKEYEEHIKFKRWTVEYGADKYLETTIHHEFGHILHDQLAGGINGARVLSEARKAKQGYIQMAEQLNNEQIEIYRLAKKNGDIYKVSAYGSSDHREFFSETFVMYMAKDPELPVYISSFFDKFFTLSKM
ncbi:Phage Mu protein F like protein [Pedobacter sp. ok626]|uniref:phage minor head protein n=1 Tax=Pedobacter sp. ok626 TaxID=1761882 RepID=UPI00087ECA3B|nr:phage minor head protein [Pedobacter sp. ok626]SDJ95643.1 Phage Mu protein F like protein [Pedobacter sp. ok626]